MSRPQFCPVCGSDALREVLRNVTFVARLGDDVSEMNPVTSYRCDLGHLFMMVESTTAGSVQDSASEGRTCGRFEDDHSDVSELCTVQELS